MLKETTTYVDFDGVSTTEEMWFHLTQLEMTEMAMDLPDGLAEGIDEKSAPAEIFAAVSEKLGRKGIIEFIKKLVAKAYGIRSVGQDGKTRFVKSETIEADFVNSLAFQNFVMTLMMDDEASLRFFNGIIPVELADKLPAGIQEAVAAK